MSVEVRALPRDEVAERLGDIATLRITVFHDWPYLYDGDAEYERRTLRPYAESPRAVVVGAFDGRALVGAATGTPLSDHEEGAAKAARDLGLPQGRVFYLAESVLLPAFHGRGYRPHLIRPPRAARAAARISLRHVRLGDPSGRPPGPAADGTRPRALLAGTRLRAGRGRNGPALVARRRGCGGDREAAGHLGAGFRGAEYVNVLETITPWEHLVSARRVAGDWVE